MRVYTYSRKSVCTGKGENVGNRIEMHREYISTKTPESDKAGIIVYKDGGLSIKNMNRSQFQKMPHDTKPNKPEHTVCYCSDCISRNASDFSSLIEGLNNYNISFVCIEEEFDILKLMGKAMMYIAPIFAQLERETIAERVHDNTLMLTRTGRWLGDITSIEFISEKIQKITTNGKIGTSYKLKDNPEELKTIDCIPGKLLESRSISGVSKYLVKQGIESHTGKIFSLLGTKEIL